MPDPFANAFSEQHETTSETQSRLRREGFRRDPQMENLARLKDADPAGFSRLPATQRVALGTYLGSKRAAETGEPVPTSMTFPHDDAA